MAMTIVDGAWTNAGDRFPFFHDFTDDANGTPTASDSGHAFVSSASSSISASTALPTVTSGRYVINSTVNATAAGYLTADLGADCSYCEVEYELTTGGSTAGHRAGIVAWESPMPSGVFTTGSNRAQAHIPVGPTGYDPQTYDSGGGGAIALGASPAYTTLGLLVQSVAIAWKKATGDVVVLGPDGVVKRFNHANVTTFGGRYFCMEVFLTNASTDSRVKFRKCRADYRLADPLNGVTGKRERLLMLGGVLP
jgi:hypothetical protein